jgi:hypothetical protein
MYSFSRENRRKKWMGQFFETKAEQCDYFECLCGSEAEADTDPKHRIQCSACSTWQHSGTRTRVARFFVILKPEKCTK